MATSTFHVPGILDIQKVTNQCVENTGWFPGYPLILKLSSILPFSIHDLAPWVSKVLFFISIVLFGKVSNTLNFNFKNAVFMLIPAFWFGFIYFNNAFPNSTILFFILLAFYSYMSDKKGLLYFSCVMASLAYPTGFLVSVVVSATMFLYSKEVLKKRLHAVIPSIFGFIGLALFFLYLHYEVGDWEAFLKIQNKYNHGLHNPLVNIRDKFRGFSFDFSQGGNSIILQSATILMLYILSSIYFFRKQLYKSQVYLLSFAFFTIYLAFPWIVGGDLSIYRSEALLLPAAILYKEVSPRINIILVSVLLFFGAVMGHLFFIDVLQ